MERKTKLLSISWSILFVLILCSLVFRASALDRDMLVASLSGWNEIPNTQLRPQCPPNYFGGSDYEFYFYCKGVTGAWSSAVYDTNRNRLTIWGGGHLVYFGNEIYALDLNKIQMQRLTDPALPLAKRNVPESELSPYDGTQPNIRHTFDGLVYIQHADRVWAFSGALASAPGWADNVTWLFNPQTTSWKRIDPTGDIPEPGLGVVSAYDPLSGKIYFHNAKGLYSFEYRQVQDEYGNLQDSGIYTLLNKDGWIYPQMNGVLDPIGRKFIIMGAGYALMYDTSSGSSYIREELNATGDTELMEYMAPGLAYDPVSGAIFGWAGGDLIYTLDLESRVWSKKVYANGPIAHRQGTFGRWRYVPDLDAFIVYNLVDDNAFTFKPMREGFDTTPPTAPLNLQAVGWLPDAVDLYWDKATDNVGVAGYIIFRDGLVIGDVSKTFFADLGLTPSTSYEYKIFSYDAADNLSSTAATKTIITPLPGVNKPLGDCSDESALGTRNDIIFCEPWEVPKWWQNGYLLHPSVDVDPQPADANSVAQTQVVSDSCIQGNCLQVQIPAGTTNGLSISWPITAADTAPEQVFMRYYLKLGNDWDSLYCNASTDDGHFPGLADVRTVWDESGVCGDSEAGDGLNCWSVRGAFRSCRSDSGQACTTNPEANTRFGIEVFHYGQQVYDLGDWGWWDSDSPAHTTGEGGSCTSEPTNFFCGLGNAGNLVPDQWYQVEIQVTMNTPGIADGVIRGWIDGVLSFEKTNVFLRHPEHDALHNRLVWLEVSKNSKSCGDATLYLDQLMVATDAPVGGINSGPTPIPPVLSFSASAMEVSLGSYVDLAWSTDNTATCIASGTWSGSKSLSGNETVGPLATDSQFTLTCTGEGGTATQSIAVDVIEPFLDTYPPTVPENLSQTMVSTDQLILKWSVSADEVGVAGYRVYDELDSQLADVTGTAYTVTGLTPTTTYGFRVSAYDAAGNESAHSELLQVTTLYSASQVKFTPIADTYLTPSTYRGMGESSSLNISTTNRALLRFDLSGLPQGASVESAVLRLYDHRKYGQLRGVGVFRAAQDWTEVGDNGGIGATRDYYDYSASLPWDNYLGDWIDSQGMPQGDVGYDVHILVDDDIPSWEEWDVTLLVQDWIDGVHSNQGMLLRNLGGGDTHMFSSRENADPTLWPNLLITVRDGLE